MEQKGKHRYSNKIKQILYKIIMLICTLIILFINPVSIAAEEAQAENETGDTSQENGEGDSQGDTQKVVDVTQTVEVAGSAEEGYYLKFKDDLDDTLTKIYNENARTYRNLGVNSIDDFKQMLKAEIATAFPDMGGVVTSSDPVSSGNESNSSSLPGDNGSGGSSSSGGSTVTIPAGTFVWPLSELDTEILGDEDWGPRNPPAPGASSEHDGVDLNNLGKGADVYAAASGTVVYAGWNGGYGNYVEIDHGEIDGHNIHTFYAHLNDISVTQGQTITVKPGESVVVGHLGDSGIGSGAHLHFGCSLDGNPHDPLSLYSNVLNINLPNPSLSASDVGSLSWKDGVNVSDVVISSSPGGSATSGGSSSGTSQNQDAVITIKENKNVGQDENKFQGSIKIRRLTPNKEVGAYDNSLEREYVPVDLSSEHTEGKGSVYIKDGQPAVPAMISMIMNKASLGSNQGLVDLSDYAYLTIPYLDNDENIRQGNMLVNKKIAQEVVDIFYELYRNGCHIARMDIVDTFLEEIEVPIINIDNDKQNGGNSENNNDNNTTDNNNNEENGQNQVEQGNNNGGNNNNQQIKDSEIQIGNKTEEDQKRDQETIKTSNKDKLYQVSADNNNTACFYVNKDNLDDDANKHLQGLAIDINPMINPKVKKAEDGSLQTDTYNASQYIDRTKKDEWSEDAKRLFIDKESVVYKTFEKYGWVWKGDELNYGHFEKNITDDTKTEAQSINSRYYDLSYVSPQVFNSYVKTGDKRALYVYTINANQDVVIASWRYDSDQGMTITTSSPISFQNALSKYVMPFELLSTLLANSQDVDFVKNLAQLAIDSQYIVTIQDSVSTTETITTITYESELYNPSGDYVTSSSSSETQTRITENATQKVELTYVDNWYIKYTKEFTGSNINQGAYDEIVQEENINVKGKKTSTQSQPTYSTNTYDGGTNDEGYYVTVTEIRKVETGTVSYSYDTGQEDISGNATDFVELYNSSSESVKNNVYQPWLGDMLASYKKTANLVDVAKYIFYQADGRSYIIDQVSTLDWINDFKPEDFTPSSGSNASGDLNITGGTVEEKVWNALTSAGYSDIATAAAMGNIQGESSFNPGIEESNGVGFGLCQWSFGRRTQLEGFAASRGKAASDVDIQIEFLLAELNPAGGADGYANYQFSGYESERQTWMTSTDIAEATTAFCAGFERPSIPRNETRIEAAQGYYNLYHK